MSRAGPRCPVACLRIAQPRDGVAGKVWLCGLSRAGRRLGRARARGARRQVFRLSFGPKSFVVVSDAALARQILLTNAANYSKGLLSEILDFVMGKGAPRRRCSRARPWRGCAGCCPQQVALPASAYVAEQPA